MSSAVHGKLIAIRPLTAKLIKNWFDWVGIDYIKDSPNMNQIENLWSITKQRLNDRDTLIVPKLEAAVLDI